MHISNGQLHLLSGAKQASLTFKRSISFANAAAWHFKLQRYVWRLSLDLHKPSIMIALPASQYCTYKSKAMLCDLEEALFPSISIHTFEDWGSTMLWLLCLPACVSPLLLLLLMDHDSVQLTLVRLKMVDWTFDCRMSQTKHRVHYFISN